jgi:hypothetical protein
MYSWSRVLESPAPSSGTDRNWGNVSRMHHQRAVLGARALGRETRHGSRMFFFNVDLGNYHEDAYGEPMTAEFAWSMLHHEYKFI